jgi:exoribonuclease-2
LRRYTDLVNQWQILACLKHGVTAPLVAPFKARDADLFAIVSAFDAAYAAYADFQNIMEHYWCLRWLSQHEARKVQAVQIKDDLLKLVDIPLILPMVGVKHPRGTQLTIELISWDEVDLSVQARLLEVSQAALAVDEDSDFDDGDSTDESEQVVEQVLSEEADANTFTVSADPIIQSNSDSSTSAL